MAKLHRLKAKGPLRDLPRLELIPVAEEINSDPLRIKEIHDLVAQVVLLGQKLGRPSKKEEIDQNAA